MSGTQCWGQVPDPTPDTRSQTHAGQTPGTVSTQSDMQCQTHAVRPSARHTRSHTRCQAHVLDAWQEHVLGADTGARRCAHSGLEKRPVRRGSFAAGSGLAAPGPLRPRGPRGPCGGHSVTARHLRRSGETSLCGRRSVCVVRPRGRALVLFGACRRPRAVASVDGLAHCGFEPRGWPHTQAFSMFASPPQPHWETSAAPPCPRQALGCRRATARLRRPRAGVWLQGNATPRARWRREQSAWHLPCRVSQVQRTHLRPASGAARRCRAVRDVPSDLAFSCLYRAHLIVRGQRRTRATC